MLNNSLVRRSLALVVLLGSVAIFAAGCIVAPAGYGYGPVYGPVYGPPVVVAPPPIVFGWGWGRYRRW